MKANLSIVKKHLNIFWCTTLESGIDVGQVMNVASGKVGQTYVEKKSKTWKIFIAHGENITGGPSVVRFCGPGKNRIPRNSY